MLPFNIANIFCTSFGGGGPWCLTSQGAASTIVRCILRQVMM